MQWRIANDFVIYVKYSWDLTIVKLLKSIRKFSMVILDIKLIHKIILNLTVLNKQKSIFTKCYFLKKHIFNKYDTHK